ncbi:MAG: porin family protein [Gammaproteobacteria bacterium]
MKRTAVLGMLALVSWSAHASDTIPGWRAGAAVTFGTFEGDDVPSAELGNKFINDNTVGFKAFGGYRVNDWLGVEGAYHVSGDYEDTSTNPDLPGKLKLSFSGFSVQGLVFIPTGMEDFEPYVKAGWYDFDDDLVVDGSTNSTSSERGLVFGAGVKFQLNEQLGFRAEYEQFDAEVGSLSGVNLAIEYSFGRRDTPAATSAE